MQTRKSALTVKCTPQDLATFKEWANAHSLTYPDFFAALMAAVREDRVIIFDPSAGRHFMDKLKQLASRQARITARKEVLLVLHEYGFVTEPFEK